MKHFLFAAVCFACLPGLLSCTNLSAQTREIDSMRNLLSQTTDDSTRIHELLRLGFTVSRTNISESKALVFEAIKLSDKLHRQQDLSSAYIYLGSTYTKTGQFDSAAYYLEAGKSVPTGFNDKNALSYHNYFGLLQKEKGNYPGAISHYRTSLNIAGKLNDESNIAGAFINLGNAYKFLGYFDSAYHYGLSALKIFEHLGDKAAMAFCYNNIGIVLYSSNQLDKALDYFMLSKGLKKELNDLRGMASTEMNLGNVWKAKKKYPEAIQAYKYALSIFRDLDIKPSIASTYIQIGAVYKASNDISNAEWYFNESDKLIKNFGFESQGADLNLERGKISEAGDIRAEDEDLESLLTGLQKAEEIKDRELVKTAYKYLADYYKSKGNFEEAFRYSQKYFALNDSLVNANLLLQYRQLETAYSVEKKDNEIKLLKADQDLKEAALDKRNFLLIVSVLAIVLLILTASLIFARYRNQQRDRRMNEMQQLRKAIARDLHDDVGSTLSGINIFSIMALENAEQQGAAVKELIMKIQDRSQKMLEAMSDIVWSINPVNDSLQQTFVKMKLFATEMFDARNIRYSFNEGNLKDSFRLGLSERRNLFLIFKEAINNTAKYSQCSEAEITFKQEGNYFFMIIRDNGEGFDPGMTFSGNGLKNMKDRAIASGGSLTVHSQHGAGTTIELKLPVT